VGRLQIGVGLVDRIAVPVVHQRVHLVEGLWHLTRERGALGRCGVAILMDVVAVVEDEVELLAGQVPEGGEVAVLIALAAGDAEAELGDGCGHLRQRARATNPASLSPHREPVIVEAVGLKSVDLNVHRMSEFGVRDYRPLLDNRVHALVRGKFPLHLDGAVRHASALEGIGRDPGPEHDAPRRGFPRCDVRPGNLVGDAVLSQAGTRELLAMAADLRLLIPQPHGTDAQNGAGFSGEGRDAPFGTLLRKLGHVVEERTALLRDLAALVRELEEATKPGRELDEDEDQKKKKKVRLLGGQIRAREPDIVLASALRRAVVSSPDEKRIGAVEDLIINADGNVAGLVVSMRDEKGCEKSIALKRELFEVTPEPGGRARVLLSAKTEDLQLAPDFKPTVEQKPDTQDRANVSRPRRPCLVPPVVAAHVSQSAMFLARTSRLFHGPGWMLLLTTIATLSHFSRVCARITGACGQWTHATDGRTVIDGKGITRSTGFDEP
jgi:hypothetical protein